MVTLVVEGGASRAAFATGVLDAFQQRGLVPEAIYGTSAGGALAAWYAAGQAHLGVQTWARAADRDLLSFRRLLWRTRPVLDFRKLYSTVYATHFGLDVSQLRRAPYPAYATLTDAETAESVYVDLRRADDPFAVLHATSALPLVSESPVRIGARTFVDGGVTDPIPLARAMEDGRKDIVLVANRPPGARPSEPAWVVRLVARRFPALAEPTRRHHELHNDAIRLAESPPEGVRVRIVRPTGETGVTRFTRDWPTLQKAIEAGREAGREALAAMRTSDATRA